MVMADATIIPTPDTKLRIRGIVTPLRVRDRSMGASISRKSGNRTNISIGVFPGGQDEGGSTLFDRERESLSA
jgi:hypothetical protein